MHQQSRKIFLIINKFAGSGKNKELLFCKLIDTLRQHGNHVEYAYTGHRGHAGELAKQAVENGFERVVAVGGDGTVNEVAEGLHGTRVAMGIFPMGSGNGLALDLKIPRHIKQSAKLITEGKPVQIDVCRVNGQHFLCTSGIGFDAQVADHMARAHKRGFVRYVQLTISESLRFKPFNVKMEIGGKAIERKVFLVTFANARQFGNNAYIAPKADVTDGLIDVIVVRIFSKILMPVFGLGLFAKYILKLPFVEHYRAEKIVLTEGTRVYHFDGEPGRITYPAEYSVDEKKLWIIKPEY